MTTAQLTVGRLISAVHLLDLASSYELYFQELSTTLRIIKLVPATEAVSLAVAAGWIKVPTDGPMTLERRGEEVRDFESIEIQVRAGIYDLAVRERYNWTYAAMRGRTELLKVVSPAVRECFDDAGLLTSTEPQIIEWWDKLADVSRASADAAKISIGRSGERLTMEYEMRRVGSLPRWQAVESNLSGFDVLSVVSAGDARPLPIEVKASVQPVQYASFHVTRREWEVACSSGAFRLDLWELHGGQTRLASICPAELKEHIPLNTGQGSWESVEIPFQAFRDRFATAPSL